jgi:transcriptional regulator with XRE-family HTH domain
MSTHVTPRLARLRSLMSTGAAKSIRLGAGVSLPEVARDVGVSHSTIYRWENNLNEPKGDAALRYAEVLDELCGVTS